MAATIISILSEAAIIAKSFPPEKVHFSIELTNEVEPKLKKLTFRYDYLRTAEEAVLRYRILSFYDSRYTGKSLTYEEKKIICEFN